VAYDRQRQVALAQTRQSMISTRKHYESDSQEIVDIFERHGFIWGGKWYHFDTMHFEYRPELLVRNK
jgi:hypothetical protein